jgi:hypothetical protein
VIIDYVLFVVLQLTAEDGALDSVAHLSMAQRLLWNPALLASTLPRTELPRARLLMMDTGISPVRITSYTFWDSPYASYREFCTPSFIHETSSVIVAGADFSMHNI